MIAVDILYLRQIQAKYDRIVHVLGMERNILWVIIIFFVVKAFCRLLPERK
jgi:hypothetical protein